MFHRLWEYKGTVIPIFEDDTRDSPLLNRPSLTVRYDDLLFRNSRWFPEIKFGHKNNFKNYVNDLFQGYRICQNTPIFNYDLRQNFSRVNQLKSGNEAYQLNGRFVRTIKDFIRGNIYFWKSGVACRHVTIRWDVTLSDEKMRDRWGWLTLNHLMLLPAVYFISGKNIKHRDLRDGRDLDV